MGELRFVFNLNFLCCFFLQNLLILAFSLSHSAFPLPLQIITSAVVLAVSLALGAVSLMGLSQGDWEQTGYQALSRAAVTGIIDEPAVPVDPEEPQQPQTQVANSPACSINSGSVTVFDLEHFVKQA